MGEVNTVVVGAGIFGQTIAAALRKTGQKVLLFDSGEAMAGSKPSACLMKPSWFSGMGKDKYEPALKTLDELFGIQDIVFELRPPLNVLKKIGTATVHWCNPTKVLAGQFTRGKVQEYTKTDRGWQVTAEVGGRIGLVQTQNLIIAAGIWTKSLVALPDLQGKVGAAFIIPGATMGKPFIRPYAPFKQLVSFQRDEGVWVGDGSAINVENWNKERMLVSYRRCMEAVGSPPREKVNIIEGIRPYVKDLKGEPCLLLEQSKGFWICTGGHKNGMVAAGYVAHTLRNRLS